MNQVYLTLNQTVHSKRQSFKSWKLSNNLMYKILYTFDVLISLNMVFLKFIIYEEVKYKYDYYAYDYMIRFSYKIIKKKYYIRRKESQYSSVHFRLNTHCSISVKYILWKIFFIINSKYIFFHLKCQVMYVLRKKKPWKVLWINY